jgi:hypothetical protein
MTTMSNPATMAALHGIDRPLVLEGRRLVTKQQSRAHSHSAAISLSRLDRGCTPGQR